MESMFTQTPESKSSGYDPSGEWYAKIDDDGKCSLAVLQSKSGLSGNDVDEEQGHWGVEDDLEYRIDDDDDGTIIDVPMSEAVPDHDHGDTPEKKPVESGYFCDRHAHLARPTMMTPVRYVGKSGRVAQATPSMI